MIITVAQLKDQIGTKGERSFLYCGTCESEYSSNAGDYWDRPKEYIFKCCNVPMLLVTKHVEYREIV